MTQSLLEPDFKIDGIRDDFSVLRSFFDKNLGGLMRVYFNKGRFK